MATAEQLISVYDGGNVTIRVLRALGWGPQLLNLGYFVWRGPLNWLNLTPSRFRLAATQQRLVRRAVRRLALSPGDRVLDVACGRGQSSYYMALANPGADVTAIDLLEPNVAMARTLFNHTRGLSFQVGDALALRFAAASFDKVFCLEAAFHFPDRERFLAEAARVLKPGGRLVLVDFMWRKTDRAAVFRDERLALVQRTWGFDDFSAVDEYRDHAAAAGLRVVELKDWSDRVTRPLQGQFDVLARLSASRIGRWLLTRGHECLKGFSKSDWAELRRAAAAHRFVHQHACYGCLVLEKPR